MRSDRRSRRSPPRSDRRRRTYPAPRGLPSANALSSQPRAVVVGAGIAGLAAATGLAERGISVDVIERENYLGGRVGAKLTPEWMKQIFNNGTHRAATMFALPSVGRVNIQAPVPLGMRPIVKSAACNPN